MEFQRLHRKDWTEEKIYNLLKQYMWSPDHYQKKASTVVTPELEAHAKIGPRWRKYVGEGGGRSSSRGSPLSERPGREILEHVLAPFGAQILHEATFDKTAPSKARLSEW